MSRTRIPRTHGDWRMYSIDKCRCPPCIQGWRAHKGLDPTGKRRKATGPRRVARVPKMSRAEARRIAYDAAASMIARGKVLLVVSTNPETQARVQEEIDIIEKSLRTHRGKAQP